MTLTRKQIKRSTRAFCKKIAKRCAKVSARITNSIPRALPHIPNLKKPSSSPKITTCKPPAPSLVPEILDQIFACLLSTCVPDTPHLPSPERYDTLFTLSLVAKSWAACATRLLYKKPFIRRGRYQFEFFLSMLPTEETNNLIANDLTSHFFQARTPIFPYPSYIKELDYGKLVMSAWAFCKAGWDTLPKIDGKVVMAIRALLKVLLQYQPTIVTLKCTLSTYGLSEKYLQVLDEEEFEGLLKNINRVSVIGNYLYGEEEVNVLKGLRNVREIEYSCLAPTQTFSPSMVDYTSLIIRQKHLQILHIDQADKSVDRIIKAIQFQSHSLVELSFTKCGFQITDPWLGIANCRKLQQLEFIECNDIKLEAVAPLLSAEWPCLKKVNLVGEGNDSEPENVCSEFVAWASEFNNKLREVEV